ncbi:MAG: hypothetical protein AB7F28_02160 [Candidatus Margulisiibacteriota bacterium]
MDYRQLEVIVTPYKSKILAKTPSFPACRGIGATEKEALEKLSAAIARTVSKLVNESMTGLLTSENYAEIVFDQTEVPAKQRKIFNLDPNLVSLHRGVSLRLKAVEQLQDKSSATKAEKNPVTQTVQTALQEPGNGQLLDLLTQALLSGQSQNEEMGFGFPLSFN